MKLKQLIQLTIVLSAIGMLSACQKSSPQTSLDKIKSKGVLTIAMSPDDPPFEYQTIKNGKNTIVGSDVDLAQAIGKKLGVKVKFQTMDFNNVLTNLGMGKVDMAISDISYTPARAKTYDLSKVYYHTANVLLIKKSNVNKYKTLSDLDGKKLAVQKGTIQEQLTQQKLLKTTAISLSQMGDEVNELKSGQVAGSVMEEMSAESFVSVNSDLMIAKITLPELSNSSGMVVALPKHSSALKSKVDAVIDQLQKDGAIDQSVKKNYALSQANK
ncbi:transporter substrate-binding domain-containing protein [Lactococcus hircilactis]|uniref:transporter substrate-binding domain-containing protein n=1 Tax=Lactococcus hircilactis TaxID=1494462 RepID=UPI003FA23CAA